MRNSVSSVGDWQPASSGSSVPPPASSSAPFERWKPLPATGTPPSIWKTWMPPSIWKRRA
jgi:hypothetical protein